MSSNNNYEVDRKRFISFWQQNIDIFGIDYGKNRKPQIVLQVDGYDSEGYDTPQDIEFHDLKVVRELATHLLNLCDKLELEEKARKDTRNAKRKKQQEAKQNRDKKDSDQTAGWFNIIRGNKDK